MKTTYNFTNEWISGFTSFFFTIVKKRKADGSFVVSYRFFYKKTKKNEKKVTYLIDLVLDLF